MTQEINKTHYIYGLFDPTNNELKYIGYTQNIKQRLETHLRKSSLKKNNHKNNWLKKILKNNLLPQILVLETYNTQEEALNAEIDLIAYFRYIGCNLTNRTNGGEMGAIFDRTPEYRANVSKSATGRKHSEITKQKISKTLTGFKRPPFSEEHKEKLKLISTNKKYSEDTIQKRVSNNKNNKATNEIIKNLKDMYASGNFTMKELSKIFNISDGQICRLINNKFGKYLKNI